MLLHGEQHIEQCVAVLAPREADHDFVVRADHAVIERGLGSKTGELLCQPIAVEGLQTRKRALIAVHGIDALEGMAAIIAVARAAVNLEKAFTAKDAKDAKENKGQSIGCRVTSLVFVSNSSLLLIPLASFAVQSLDLR